jgi:hypothetical protein
MSQYLNLAGDVLLELSFPKEKIDVILKDLNLSHLEKIGAATFEQKRLIILVSFREFLKGNLFLEEFSEIASHMKMLFPMEGRTQEQDDYELMIYEAADMSIYLRAFNPKRGNTFGGYMDTMWEYFNKYKNLLAELPTDFSKPSALEGA